MNKRPMRSEFDMLNQGDPDINLGLLITTNSGEPILVPGLHLKEQMTRYPHLWQDFMSGTGLFGDETVGQERGRQRTSPIVLYFEPNNFY